MSAVATVILWLAILIGFVGGAAMWAARNQPRIRTSEGYLDEPGVREKIYGKQGGER